MEGDQKRERRRNTAHNRLFHFFPEGAFNLQINQEVITGVCDDDIRQRSILCNRRMLHEEEERKDNHNSFSVQ